MSQEERTTRLNVRSRLQDELAKGDPPPATPEHRMSLDELAAALKLSLTMVLVTCEQFIAGGIGTPNDQRRVDTIVSALRAVADLAETFGRKP